MYQGLTQFKWSLIQFTQFTSIRLASRMPCITLYTVVTVYVHVHIHAYTMSMYIMCTCNGSGAFERPNLLVSY